MKLTKKEFEKILKDKVVSECGVTLDVASAEQIYRCMAMIVRQIMSDRQKQFQAKTLGEGKKQVYYLCMEFLMGRSLRTSLFNLGLNEVAEQVLADADIKIDTIYEQEPDAGLGNGGLGRLAACYLDGASATDCIRHQLYSVFVWVPASSNGEDRGRLAEALTTVATRLTRCGSNPPRPGTGDPKTF